MKVSLNERDFTLNFTSSTVNGLSLVLNYTLFKSSNGDSTVLYRVHDVNKFVATFLGKDVNLLDEKRFLLPSLYRQVENYAYGTDICVKHVFSSIIAIHCLLDGKKEKLSQDLFVRFLIFFFEN